MNNQIFPRGLRLLRRSRLASVRWRRVFLAGVALQLFCSLTQPARGDATVGDCSQAALMAALAQGGNVTFGQDCSITLSSTITIGNNVTLDAAGHAVAISGNNTVRLFTVSSGATFGLKGLTLTAGNSTNGGALLISSGGTASITNCIFAGNVAAGADGIDGVDGGNDANYGGNAGGGSKGGAAWGGAIFNAGYATVAGSQFLSNSAAGGNGGNGGNGGSGAYQGGNGGGGAAGGLGYGGAIYSTGTTRLTNCSFSGNKTIGGTAGTGGTGGSGAFNGLPGGGGGGATGAGGAVYSLQPLFAWSCTFLGNTSSGGDSQKAGASSGQVGSAGAVGGSALGAGIYCGGLGALTNCTFAGNHATAGSGGDGGDGTFTGGNGGGGGTGGGGGLWNAGTVSVANCTFSGSGVTGGTNGLAGNGATPGSDGPPGPSRGGNVGQSAGSFVLVNSILTASTSGGNGSDTSGSRIVDGGRNISSDASLPMTGTGSVKNTDPLLGALANNGGPTLTLAPQSGSPAVDKLPTGSAPAVDQRGVPRPQGTSSDIGAVERVTTPVFALQPVSQTGTNGSAVTFTSFAFGDSVTYQWRYNAGNISGATSSNYTISAVAPANQGSYDVLATTASGTTPSTAAYLTVVSPPVITSQPVSQTVTNGGSATFAVAVTGDAPISYQWQFNGTNVLGVGSTNSLTVTNAQLYQAGPYTVVIANNSGTITSAVATLTISLPPQILQFSATNQTVMAGSNVTFSVSATGALPLAYQWRFNGVDLAGATSNALTISNAQTTNAGDYLVIVSNSFGGAFAGPAHLTVALPFVITGRVLDPSGTLGLGGVEVMAATNLYTFTDTNGNYTLSSLQGNTNYSVSAFLNCYRIYAANFTNPLPFISNNATILNFVSSNDLHLISGYVTNASGGGLSNVVVRVRGGSLTNITDGSGYYSFTNLCAGVYPIEAVAAGYSFQPAFFPVTLPPDSNNVSFAAYPDRHFISGRATDGANGLSNVIVRLSGAAAMSTNSDANGNFVFGGLIPGSYTVTPTQSCRVFQPLTQTVTLASSTNYSGTNLTDFIGINQGAWTIRGQITDGLNGIRGITVQAGNQSTVTDASGNYSFHYLCPGAYSVTPSSNGYCFTPASMPVLVGPDSNTVNFTASRGIYRISGNFTGVTNELGPIQVTLLDSHGTPIATNHASGSFSFSNLCDGAYTVIPQPPGCYQFYPSSHGAQVGPDNSGLDFFTFTVNPAVTLSGRVAEGASGLSGVTVSVGGQTNVTDANGNYAFPASCPGTFVIVPSLPGYRFQPAWLQLTASVATSNLNFAAFPTLNISILPNGAVQLSAIATAGHSYQIQASTNLTNWVAIYTTSNVSTNASIITFVDTAAPNLPKRFYRLAENYNLSPALAISRGTNGAIQLSFMAAAGQVYQLRASTNFANWTGIYTNSPATNTTLFQYTDTAATNFPQRFYRLAQ